MGEVIDEQSLLHGQAQVCKYMFHFVDSMALKSAVELRIADIIHSHGHPITLSQIAAGIDSPSSDLTTLSRILRLLVRRNMFTSTVLPNDGSTVHGLTPTQDGCCMFTSIPAADALFIKWVLHDWGDENCVKILKNCRKTLPEKTGKLTIVEAVLKLGGDDKFGDTGYVTDLVMVAHSSGGKERTEDEWKKLLTEGGFPNYKIIEIPAWSSILIFCDFRLYTMVSSFHNVAKRVIRSINICLAKLEIC